LFFSLVKVIFYAYEYNLDVLSTVKLIFLIRIIILLSLSIFVFASWGCAKESLLEPTYLLVNPTQTTRLRESATLYVETDVPEQMVVLTPTVSDLLLRTTSEIGLVETQQDNYDAGKPDQRFIICSPLEGHSLDELREIISAPYAPPPLGKEERHHGVDFSYYRRGERLSIQGVGVQSVLPGTVRASISGAFPYGNFVIVETQSSDLSESLQEVLGIKQGESLYLLYAHMQDEPMVILGEELQACQSIGYVGKSGNAVEPHLHLEARLGPPGQLFTEMAFYSTQTTELERENYVLWRTSGEFQHLDPMKILGGRE